MLTNLVLVPTEPREPFPARGRVASQYGRRFVHGDGEHGYGFLATPLELVQAYGASRWGKPTHAREAASITPSPVVRRVVSKRRPRKTREILRQVVEKGTGKDRAASALYTTAGKTATSYVRT